MQTRYQVKTPPVIHQTLEDEVIVVDLDSGTYYSITGSGAVIWGSLDAGATGEETVERILRRYDAERADVAGAVTRFVDELVREELVVPAAGNGVAPATDAAGHDGARLPFEEPVLNRYTDMQELLMLDPIHEVDEQGWPHALEPDGQAVDG